MNINFGLFNNESVSSSLELITYMSLLKLPSYGFMNKGNDGFFLSIALGISILRSLNKILVC
jgi:hypothetical protein